MEKLKKLSERIAKLALAMHQAALAEDWQKVADCDVNLAEVWEVFTDSMDVELSMEQLGFQDGDTRRIASEADLIANVVLA